MIRTVISDLGRVVLWFDNAIFLRKLADGAGKPFEDVKAAVHGDLELLRRFDAGAVTPCAFFERVTGLVGADISYEAFFEMYNDIFSLNAPAVDLLASVKAAGCKTLLLSNTDPERFAFVRRRFPEVLFFDHYVLSYELKLLKPDPAIYLAAARLADTSPRECVFIDDMEENVKGAVDAGLVGIHYMPTTDLAAELKKLGLRF
ncbi:MAG: HAD family phosphatase [Acidobacteria bacterium]|nr:HAD family phosphatase [Acidobacteriota bacterium]MBE3129320.1 HAD family phosphatase [Acidobacteriota bacterium]